MRSGKDLLRLALTHGPGAQSLSGTSVCSAAVDLISMRKTAIRKDSFTDLVSTTGHVAERADFTQIRAGQTTIVDRGYVRRTNLSRILAQQGHFIVRIGWQSLQLYSKNNQKSDLSSLLPKDDRTVDRIVHLKGLQQRLRLLIRRLPTETRHEHRGFCSLGQERFLGDGSWRITASRLCAIGRRPRR